MSLFEKVRDLLAEQKPKLADAFIRGYLPVKSKDEVSNLNRYFRIELTKAPVSTLDERESLVDGLDDEMWLKYFEIHVLPTLVRFNLPS